MTGTRSVCRCCLTPSIVATVPYWPGWKKDPPPSSPHRWFWPWGAWPHSQTTPTSCTAGTPLNTPPSSTMTMSVMSSVSAWNITTVLKYPCTEIPLFWNTVLICSVLSSGDTVLHTDPACHFLLWVGKPPMLTWADVSMALSPMPLYVTDGPHDGDDSALNRE